MWQRCDRAPAVVFSAEEALAMDRWLLGRGETLAGLMAHAGAAVAVAATELCAEHGLSRVLGLAGPGNNGGDVRVALEQLESRHSCRLWQPLADEPVPELGPHTLVLDGLFGVGLCRPVGGRAAAALAAVSRSGCPVLAVDVPSGLHATTGEVLGCALKARWTLCLVGPKAGFFVGAGPDHVGLWRAAPIGFPVQEASDWVLARRERSA